MSPALRVRAVERDDVGVLAPIDGAYAERHQTEPFVSSASLSLYGRSGHSFVVESPGGVLGFVLAQSVWTGARPVLRIARLAALEPAPRETVADASAGTDAAQATGADGAAPERVLALLAEAVTKSAYDAAVYDLEAVVPKSDAAGRAALEGADYTPRPARVYTRTLGSRGQPS